MTLAPIAFGAAAFLLTFAGVFICRRWATRRDLIAVPNERSSHKEPTPTGGGLAIVVVTTALWSIYGFSTTQLMPLIPLTMGGMLIAVVSWVDDLRPLRPLFRFAVHGLAAAAAVYAFGYFETINLPLLHEINLGWIGLPITIIWIIGLTNSFNFIQPTAMKILCVVLLQSRTKRDRLNTRRKIKF